MNSLKPTLKNTERKWQDIAVKNEPLLVVSRVEKTIIGRLWSLAVASFLYMRQSLLALILLTPTLVVLGILFLGPLVQSVISSLQDEAGLFTLQNYGHILNSGGFLADLWFTLGIGLATILICTFICLPLALLLRHNFWGKQILWVVLLLPLVTPHIIAAYALRLFLSSSSPLLFWLPQNANGKGFSISLVNAWPGLVIALSWKFFPVLLLSLSATLNGLPSSYEEAARDIGAGFWRRFCWVLIPLLAPSWLAGTSLVFILVISQFTITLIVYGGQKLTTIPLDIYFETFSSHRPGIAAALGLVLMLITLILVGIITSWIRVYTARWTQGAGIAGLGNKTTHNRNIISNNGNSSRGRTIRRQAKGVVTTLAVLVTALFVLAPMLGLIFYSFSEQWLGGSPWPSRFTLHWYDYFFRYEDGLGALGQSLLVALLVVAVTLLAALPASYALGRYRFWGRSLLESLFLAKTATPVIIVAVGTASLFYSWHLNDTLIGLVMAHTAGALPLAIRTITLALERIDRAQEEAARDMGAGALRRLGFVVLPLALGGIVNGAALAFLFSMDEFTVTFLISGVKYTTLPLRLYSALGQGYIESAAAGSVLLMIPSLICLGLMLKLLGIGRVASEVGTGGI